MSLIYSEDHAPKRRRPFTRSVWEMDPAPRYLQHYENRLYLEFFLKRGTRDEQRQALRELKICDRKLAFWQRHPRWDATKVTAGIARLKARWR